MPPTIITCAVTGSIHTPSMSPFLPITPEDIADQAIAAAAAGAAVLHLHVRDPQTGQPSSDPDLFVRLVERVRAGTDAILSITTGGSARMTVTERLAGPVRLHPEMCSLNLGTMNFALYPLAAKPRDWTHDWERPFLEATRDGIFRNTFADIEQITSTLGGRFGTRFECECYDVGHLYSLAHLMDRKVITGKVFVQFVLGILGGIGADAESLGMMRATAQRLFGDDHEWSVLPAGRSQMQLCTMAAMMGGHVRVGLEDNLWLGPGVLAPDNAALVGKIRGLLNDLHIPVATVAEARAILGLAA
jgi:uncharacterized protein (DUF849 family)